MIPEIIIILSTVSAVNALTLR